MVAHQRLGAVGLGLVLERWTPFGLRVRAVGDGGWCYWLIWAFGGMLVDKDNNVVINSPQTIQALEYEMDCRGVATEFVI